jgi:hypothetical protein
LIGLGLLLTATTLGDRAKRTVVCKGESVYLDARNISGLLSPQEVRLVRAFLAAADHTHTCRSLLIYIQATDGGDDPVAVVPTVDCDRCMELRWTASNCPAYRNLKNRINATKKYLELLQIGTIVPVSESPRETKEAGWRLRLFDDVRVAPHGPFAT